MASTALAEFRASLRLAEELMRVERSYRNPPPLSDRKVVEALRGASAVLMVGAFELFLKSAVEEHLAKITALDPPPSLDALPDNIRVHSVYSTLELAMKGPPYGMRPEKKDRLPAITLAAQMVVSKTLNPKVFSATGGNPGPETVREICKQAGLPGVFEVVRPMFERKWGRVEARTFVPDKLEEIVNRRHAVAHTAQALNIDRAVLRESVRFLKALATVLDLSLAVHVRRTIANLP